MNQSDMLLQMVYAAVQSTQTSLPQSTGTQQKDSGQDFRTLLDEKRTELNGQKVEQPVENGEAPKADDPAVVPEDVLAQAMVLTQTMPVPAATVVVTEEPQPLAVDALAENPTAAEVGLEVQQLAPLAPEAEAVVPEVTVEAQSAEPTAQILPTEQPAEQAQPQDGAEETPAGEEIISVPQTKEEPAAQTKEESAGQESPMSKGEKTAVRDDSYEVLSAQSGSAEQPLFEESASLPQRVGDAPVVDTQSEQMDSTLANQITSALDSGEQRLELKLTPEHLGNVVVEMSRTPEGVLHVVLHVESEQAAKLLSEHSGTLGVLLQSSQQGEVRIEVQRPDQSEQPWQQPDQESGQNSQQGHQQREERRQSADPERFLQQLRLGLIPAES